MKKSLLVLIAAVALFSSCNSVIDKKIHPETIKEDLENIKKDNEGTYEAEDYEAIAGFLMQKAFTKALAGEKIDDKKWLKIDLTYREILDEAKSNRIEFEKKMSDYENVMSQLLKKIDFKVVANNLQADEYNIRKQLELEFHVTNSSGKDIKGIEGSLLVLDMFDNEISKLVLL